MVQFEPQNTNQTADVRIETEEKRTDDSSGSGKQENHSGQSEGGREEKGPSGGDKGKELKSDSTTLKIANAAGELLGEYVYPLERVRGALVEGYNSIPEEFREWVDSGIDTAAATILTYAARAGLSALACADLIRSEPGAVVAFVAEFDTFEKMKNHNDYERINLTGEERYAALKRMVQGYNYLSNTRNRAPVISDFDLTPLSCYTRYYCNVARVLEENEVDFYEAEIDFVLSQETQNLGPNFTATEDALNSATLAQQSKPNSITSFRSADEWLQMSETLSHEVKDTHVTTEKTLLKNLILLDILTPEMPITAPDPILSDRLHPMRNSTLNVSAVGSYMRPINSVTVGWCNIQQYFQLRGGFGGDNVNMYWRTSYSTTHFVPIHFSEFEDAWTNLAQLICENDFGYLISSINGDAHQVPSISDLDARTNEVDRGNTYYTKVSSTIRIPENHTRIVFVAVDGSKVGVNQTMAIGRTRIQNVSLNAPTNIQDIMELSRAANNNGNGVYGNFDNESSASLTRGAENLLQRWNNYYGDKWSWYNAWDILLGFCSLVKESRATMGNQAGDNPSRGYGMPVIETEGIGISDNTEGRILLTTVGELAKLPASYRTPYGQRPSFIVRKGDNTVDFQERGSHGTIGAENDMLKIATAFGWYKPMDRIEFKNMTSMEISRFLDELSCYRHLLTGGIFRKLGLSEYFIMASGKMDQLYKRKQPPMSLEKIFQTYSHGYSKKHWPLNTGPAVSFMPGVDQVDLDLANRQIDAYRYTGGDEIYTSSSRVFFTNDGYNAMKEGPLGIRKKGTEGEVSIGNFANRTEKNERSYFLNYLLYEMAAHPLDQNGNPATLFESYTNSDLAVGQPTMAPMYREMGRTMANEEFIEQVTGSWRIVGIPYKVAYDMGGRIEGNVVDNILYFNDFDDPVTVLGRTRFLIGYNNGSFRTEKSNVQFHEEHIQEGVHDPLDF